MRKRPPDDLAPAELGSGGARVRVGHNPLRLSAMSSSQPVRDDYADIIDVSELLANDAFDDPSVSIGALDDSPEAQEHGLFLDRLEEFMLTQEDSVKAFALREGKPLEFVSRAVEAYISTLAHPFHLRSHADTPACCARILQGLVRQATDRRFCYSN